MNSRENERSGRLKHPLDFSSGDLFFSLSDYRNNSFLSSDLNKVLDFFNRFESQGDLIEWMKERPKGIANVYEVDGDKDIIVVIPTADFSGKYAKECRENIFRGLQIVFVESGEIPDPYFNYAHNCNVGIQVALKYNPKWVIISNDDMEAVDSVEKLKAELSKINIFSGQIVLAKGKGFHSRKIKIGYRTRWIDLLKLNKNNAKIIDIENSIKAKYGRLLGIDRYYSLHTIFTKSMFLLKNAASFFIVSSTMLIRKNGILFDETFINGLEDVDAVLAESVHKPLFINYRINDIGGATLGGMNTMRFVRDIINRIYFTYKFENGYFKKFGIKQ